MSEMQKPSYEVLARSNGHHWIKYRSTRTILCCRDCGFIRRQDDQNKPCKGVAAVGPRDSHGE